MLTGNNSPAPDNTGALSSPKLLGVLTATQTQRGQPKHPSSVDPPDPRRNHLTRPNAALNFHPPPRGAAPQIAARGN